MQREREKTRENKGASSKNIELGDEEEETCKKGRQSNEKKKEDRGKKNEERGTRRE